MSHPRTNELHQISSIPMTAVPVAHVCIPLAEYRNLLKDSARLESLTATVNELADKLEATNKQLDEALSMVDHHKTMEDIYFDQIKRLREVYEKKEENSHE